MACCPVAASMVSACAKAWADTVNAAREAAETATDLRDVLAKRASLQLMAFKIRRKRGARLLLLRVCSCNRGRAIGLFPEELVARPDKRRGRH